ncbi:MAG TPA: arginine--tRNA ligase [Candidatus Omnitrophota bacterium]|nr:arginine--tRNA ligase [Candidatus Omnitrophota bacterium]
MKSDIYELLNACLPELSARYGAEIPGSLEHNLEIPKNKEHGDLSSNLALKLASCFKKNPFAIAAESQKLIEEKLPAFPRLREAIAQIKVERPGFINFYFATGSVLSVLSLIRKEDRLFGKSGYGTGRRVILEYVSANPTGPLTIAHGRQACVGDALARIMKMAGFDVFREYYLNDAGRQINTLGLSTWFRYLELLGKKIDFPQDGYQGAYICDIAKKVLAQEGRKFFDASDAEAVPFFAKFAAQDILSTIKRDLEELRVSFDEYFSEQGLRDRGAIETVLGDLEAKDLIYEEEGALWFRSTRFGDDKNRVLKKSTGEYTYLAPDIAYHAGKLQRRFDMMVNLWGPDHHGYVPRMRAAVQALCGDSEKLKVLLVQLTTLYRAGQPVKMSTRAGEFVTLRELMGEVGADATRFFFLMRRVESLLDFDLDLAKKKSDENPVFYVQYAHARICSIIEYAKTPIPEKADLSRLKEDAELELIKHLSLFPEMLIQASQTLEPYRVVEYLRDLATSFHKFYTLCRVVSDDEPLTQTRLFLVDCARIVLRNGLEVLGISQPAKM